jgi:hypothetical protein
MVDNLTDITIYNSLFVITKANSFHPHGCVVSFKVLPDDTSIKVIFLPDGHVLIQIIHNKHTALLVK